MAGSAEQIADADAQTVLTPEQVEKLRVIRAGLAELLVEIGADPNGVLRRTGR